jgi:hypothetical protein
MRKTYADLPGWSFDVQEVSNGVYRVVATDALIERCKAECKALSPGKGFA